MFQPFASDYLLGRLTVTPYSGDEPVIQEEDHERINEHLYGGDGVFRIDRPLVMKVDERHIPVTGDASVPSNTLALPDDIIEDLRLRNPPEQKEVLLAKPDAGLEFMFHQEQPSE